jgi:hypothetical protein
MPVEVGRAARAVRAARGRAPRARSARPCGVAIGLAPRPTAASDRGGALSSKPAGQFAAPCRRWNSRASSRVGRGVGVEQRAAIAPRRCAPASRASQAGAHVVGHLERARASSRARHGSPRSRRRPAARRGALAVPALRRRALADDGLAAAISVGAVVASVRAPRAIGARRPASASWPSTFGMTCQP